MNRQTMAFLLVSFAGWAGSAWAGDPIYKWTDAEGRIHYGHKKPADAIQAQTLDLPTTGSATATPTDPAAEVARIQALSAQMARERQAVEQARQAQTIRNLEQANQQLQNALLSEQLQQQQEQKEKDAEQETLFLGDPFLRPYPNPDLSRYPRPYPRPWPPNSAPPHPPWTRPPCAPWPECRHPIPPQPPTKPPTKPPIPPFKPKPIGVSPTTSEGFIRQR